jgi:plasmid maintenance system killer protein
VDIIFSSPHLQRDCCDFVRASRKWGDQQAQRLNLRLDQLRAVNTFADLNKLPFGNLHPLLGNRRGQFSLAVLGGLRLIFQPAGDPHIIQNNRGEWIWQAITAVEILEVVDYHD